MTSSVERSLVITGADVLIDGQVEKGVTIVVEDGLIVSLSGRVGPGVEGPGEAEVADPATAMPPNQTVIDGSGLLAMPGLINSHTHAAMTLLRGVAEDVGVDSWFNDFVWPIETNVTPDDVRLGTELACAEMIQGGITSFADHYFHEANAALAVADSGLRANLGCTFFTSDDTNDLQTSIEFAQEWHGAEGGRITTSLAPHAPYTCSDDELKAAASAARQLGIKVHLHAAEHREQTESSLQRRGVTPIAVLEDTGVLDAGAIIGHGCGILDRDLPILASYSDRVGIAHCPKVYLKHGLDRLTPIRELRDCGVAVGLGTDGPAGCNSIDGFEAMRLTAMTQKHLERDATWLTMADVLEMAGPLSAATIGVNAGAIKVGAKADIILVDLGGLHCQPLHDPLAALIYSIRASDVRTTIVDGRPLMVDRQLLTIDIAELTKRVKGRGPQLASTTHNSPQRRYEL